MTSTIPIDDVLPWLQANAVWLGLATWYLVAYFVVRLLARRENWETGDQVAVWMLSPIFLPHVAIFCGIGWLVSILLPDEIKPPPR